MNEDKERYEEQTPAEETRETVPTIVPDERDEELALLRADLETARGQVTKLENERYLLSRGVPEDDLDYYAFKIGQTEGAKDDFKKAARDYLKAHPIKRATVNSGAELSGSRRSKPATASELMNSILRNR